MEKVIITLNDSEAATIYQLEGGEILSTSEDNPQDNRFIDIMAKRTFDESGNYKVEGLELIDKQLADEHSFTIPANIRTGTRVLELIPDDMPNLVARAQFTANGIKRATQTTIYKEFTNTIVIAPVPATTTTDPLAQSFQFETDTIITAIGIFFAAKDSYSATVQIRNIVNGYPGSLVYTEKIIEPQNILVSANSSIETKVTFDDPVLCKANEQYCIVVLSESANAALYISTLGEKDLITKSQVVKMPYAVGLLFSSCNATAWTAHQSQDLKFKVYSYKRHRQ